MIIGPLTASKISKQYSRHLCYHNLCKNSQACGDIRECCVRQRNMGSKFKGLTVNSKNMNSKIIISNCVLTKEHKGSLPLVVYEGKFILLFRPIAGAECNLQIYHVYRDFAA